MLPGVRRKLNPFIEPEFFAEQIERAKASVRAMVEHPFRVLKRQFGCVKVRYRGLTKNTAQIVTLFALSNLWMQRRLMGATRRGRPNPLPRPGGVRAEPRAASQAPSRQSSSGLLATSRHQATSNCASHRVVQTFPNRASPVYGIPTTGRVLSR